MYSFLILIFQIMSDKYDSECDFVIEDEVEDSELSDEISLNFKRHSTSFKKDSNNRISSKFLIRRSCNILTKNHKRFKRKHSCRLLNPKVTKCVTHSVFNKKNIDIAKEKNCLVESKWLLASNNIEQDHQEVNTVITENATMINESFELIDGIDSNASVEELLEKYKSIKFELECLEKEDEYIDWEENSQKNNYSEISNEVEANNLQHTGQIKISVENANNMSVASDDEDSELHKLRLQALASRSKPNEIAKFMLNDECSFNKENMSLHEKISSQYSVSELTDNHEIIDMAVDSDEETLDEKTLPCSSLNNEEELDLETEKLRAQLLESLKGKKLQLSERKPTESSSDNSTLTNDLHSANINKSYTKDPLIDSCAKPIPVISSMVLQEKNALSNRRKVIYNRTYKKENVTTDHSSLLYSRPTPFIINLHDDSSTDEDDAEAKKCDMNKKAALESLERLIDSAKDSTTLDNKSDNTESDVSLVQKKESLSDSQRKEYSNLNKIITQIDVLKVEEDRQSYWKAYNLLTDKLQKAKSMVLTHSETLKMAKIQSNEKKLAFITSQVAVRRLQEQLTVATKLKEVNENSMFLANSHLQAVQTTIQKSKFFIKQLEAKRTKLAQQVFKQSSPM